MTISALIFCGNLGILRPSGLQSLSTRGAGSVPCSAVAETVDDPLLSTCWANALGARFMKAYELAGVTISGNAPDCQ